MLARYIDWVCIVFLIIATIMAIVIDLQPLYPESTPVIKHIHKAFCDDYQSTLLCYDTPVWLHTMTYIQLVFVIPTYLLGIYGMICQRNWVKDYMLMLGFYLLTTSIVYIVETYYNDKSPKKTLLIYSTIPFVVIPGLMVLRFLAIELPYSSKTKTE
ncbi:hypothetical protein LOD99_15311 [Oopsacas minuta]|uniref:EXPERA domain-containing protein n=1 Tax=Oopsacas minuta TaxID=111878 RepID=A0AAV7KDT2_9METZ|nr:hypothetical protein LOD99_15311 [Oopsacas minuta]